MRPVKPTPVPVRSGTRLPTVNHWVRQAEITRSIVEGVEVQAICGEWLQVTVEGGSTAAGERAVVCPLCELTRETLP